MIREKLANDINTIASVKLAGDGSIGDIIGRKMHGTADWLEPRVQATEMNSEDLQNSMIDLRGNLHDMRQVLPNAFKSSRNKAADLATSGYEQMYDLENALNTHPAQPSHLDLINAGLNARAKERAKAEAGLMLQMMDNNNLNKDLWDGRRGVRRMPDLWMHKLKQVTPEIQGGLDEALMAADGLRGQVSGGLESVLAGITGMGRRSILKDLENDMLTNQDIMAGGAQRQGDLMDDEIAALDKDTRDAVTLNQRSLEDQMRGANADAETGAVVRKMISDAGGSVSSAIKTLVNNFQNASDGNRMALGGAAGISALLLMLKMMKDRKAGKADMASLAQAIA